MCKPPSLVVPADYRRYHYTLILQDAITLSSLCPDSPVRESPRIPPSTGFCEGLYKTRSSTCGEDSHIRDFQPDFPALSGSPLESHRRWGTLKGCMRRAQVLAARAVSTFFKRPLELDEKTIFHDYQVRLPTF